MNTYRQASPPDGLTSLVFDGESFENLSTSWKARESYQVVSKDEFTEAFDLAVPTEPFRVCSRNHFKSIARCEAADSLRGLTESLN